MSTRVSPSYAVSIFAYREEEARMIQEATFQVMEMCPDPQLPLPLYNCWLGKAGDRPISLMGQGYWHFSISKYTSEPTPK